MEENFFKGKWTEAKGEIRNAWGKLTDDEVEQTKGNATSIAGLIQQKYGHAKEDVMTKLHDISKSFAKGAADKSEEVKQDLRDNNERDAQERKAV